MVESSNPTTGAPRVRPVNRFLKKGALTFGACLALADEVFAQQGGGSPWTQAVQALQAAFTGPIATGLALVATGLLVSVRTRSRRQRRARREIFTDGHHSDSRQGPLLDSDRPASGRGNPGLHHW